MTRSDKQGNWGCLILFFLLFPVTYVIGVFIDNAGPYTPAVAMLGVVGFVGGAALGAYVSVRNKHEPWWSACRWAIYGLLGVCLMTFLAFHVVNSWVIST